MTLGELRTVVDPYGPIEILSADSGVTLACKNEAKDLIECYDEFPVDLVISAGCELQVYVCLPSTEPGVSF